MVKEISIYEYVKDWFDFCFENPDTINPNHSALYFFILSHSNRLGWKKKFGLPTTMSMEAIGIKSYNTYIKTFNQLNEFGFINIIEKSKNQYSSNIIALSKFNKALDKALDKATLKHLTKQRESTVQSTVQSKCSIIIQDTNTLIHQDTNTLKEQKFFLFDLFWNKYEKKVGRDGALKVWLKIDVNEMDNIIDKVSNYVNSTPDKTFRKNATTYLNGKHWNDEIIITNNNNQNGTRKNDDGTSLLNWINGN